MIDKVLWQTWLNWCVIKMIYTPSVEHHRYGLWKWRGCLQRSQTPRRGSPMSNKGTAPWNYLVWSEGVCKLSHQPTEMIGISLSLFVPVATKGKGRKPNCTKLRCSYSPFLLKCSQMWPWENAHWSQGEDEPLKAVLALLQSKI